MDTTHSTAACSKCKQCGRILTKDEIGLHKKLYNRGATSYFCIDCSSQYLEVPVPLLQKKIEEAKEEQQREFRNERAELEAAYQAELQAKTAQISQLKAPEEQKTQSPKQSFNYFD